VGQQGALAVVLATRRALDDSAGDGQGRRVGSGCEERNGGKVGSQPAGEHIIHVAELHQPRLEGGGRFTMTTVALQGGRQHGVHLRPPTRVAQERDGL
jgi:hypothetical protein